MKKNNFIRTAQKSLRFLSYLVLAVSFFSVLTGGLLLYRTHELRDLDSSLLYVAGYAWAHGHSPYNYDAFKNIWRDVMKNERFSDQHNRQKHWGVFAYPPSIGVIVIPLALFKWSTARWLLDIVNVSFFLGALFFLLKLLLNTFRDIYPSWKIYLATGIACFSWAFPLTLLMRQTSLIALFGCLGAIYYLRQKKLFLAAVLILFASIKPTFSILIIIYLMIDYFSLRFILLSTLIIGAVSLGVLVVGKSSNVLGDYLNSLSVYSMASYNRNNMSGLVGIWYRLNLLQMVWIFPAVGSVLTVLTALFFKAKEKKSSDVIRILKISFIFSLTPILVPLHGYDYVILLMPSVVALTFITIRNSIFILPIFVLLFGLTYMNVFLYKLFHIRLFYIWYLIGLDSIFLGSLGIAGISLYFLFRAVDGGKRATLRRMVH